jgi:hypothetical protein
MIIKVEGLKGYLESKDGSVICRYTIIPYYFLAEVESKDRTKIKKHVILTDTLKELEDYINSLK